MVDWTEYNNNTWVYEELRTDQDWALVLGQRIGDGQKSVSIFHLVCRPDPKLFVEAFNGTWPTNSDGDIDEDLFTLGCAGGGGECDKCDSGKAPISLAKMAMFLYPNDYLDGEW